MYIVVRTFRDANGVFGVGSIVDPTSVRTFRSRLQQRHIVDVQEDNVEEWARYFKNRHGIDLSEKLKEYIDAQPEVEAPVVSKVETGSSIDSAEQAIPPEPKAEPVDNTTSSEEDESW